MNSMDSEQKLDLKCKNYSTIFLQSSAQTMVLSLASLKQKTDSKIVGVSCIMTTWRCFIIFSMHLCGYIMDFSGSLFIVHAWNLA